MGMCKGCSEIFKTEKMNAGYCEDCQKSSNYKDNIKRDDQLKVKNKKEQSHLTIIYSMFLLLTMVTLSYKESYLIAAIPAIFLALILFKDIERRFYKDQSTTN